MRGGLAWLGLVLVASAAVATPLAEDPADDAAVGGAAPMPAGSFPGADLRALSLQATPPDLLVSFHIADLETERPLVDSSIYTLEFVFDGARYLVHAYRNVPVNVAIGETYTAALYVFDEGFGYWRPLTELPAPVETEANVVTVAVPLQKVVDPTGLPLRNGSQLTALVAQSYHGQDRIAGGGTALPFPPPADDAPVPVPFILHDRLPDADALTYAVSLPLVDGAVLLDSPDPARVTNGGPGTFVYPLRATNAASKAVVAAFVVEGLPEEWAWSLVDEQMELGPQESRTTGVVVRPPLNHVHGTSTNMTVRVLLDGLPTETTTTLQLLYSDPAQPAGHHPSLYLHAANTEQVLMLYDVLEPAFGWTDRLAYMNTNEQDPLDSGGPVNAVTRGDSSEWRIPLSPGLGMGLDFHAAGVGRLTASFASSGELPVEDATFQARLVLANASGDLLLAEGPRTTPITVGGPSEVTMDLGVLPAADYVPYAPRTNLVLVVSATFTEPGARIGMTTLDLLAGGRLDLPLQEYQDQVPLQELGGLRIQVDPDPASANPGDRVRFTVHLDNDGAQAIDALVEPLAVSSANVASIDPPRLRIGAGSSAQFEVEVVVAEQAIHGELFNAFVAVRPEGDGPAALVRLTTLVTTADEVESAAGDAGRDAPGLAWPVALLVLAATAVALARGR